MKKRLQAFVLAVCLLMPLASYSQTNTLTVSDGTATHARVPVYGLYVDYYLRCQTIYPATMFANAATGVSMVNGQITALTYYLSSPAGVSWGNANFTVKLMEVSAEALDGFASTATAVTVYTGSLDATQSEMTITFDTSYTYQGGNLLVEITNNSPGAWSNAYFYGTNTDAHTTWQGQNSSSVDGIAGDYINFIPKTTFSYTGGSVISCHGVQGLALTNVTSTSMTISWTDTLNSGATYSVYNILNDSLLASGLTSTTYTASGLEPNHLYGFKVEANCSATDASVRSAVAGRTNCAALSLPYSETFEDFAANVTPSCWHVMNGQVTIRENINYAHSGEKSLDFRGSLSNIIAMPEMTGDLSGKQLYFYTRPELYNNLCGSLSVGYVTSLTDTSTFVAVKNFGLDLWDDPVVFHEAEVNFGTVPAGAYVAFRHNALHNNYYWYVDDVELMDQPSCRRPVDPQVTGVSSSSITLSWADTLNASGTTYSIYSWPDTTLVATGITTTTYTINDLEPNTSYVFAVMSDCSATDHSRWYPLRVRTACGEIPIPYVEDFDDETPGYHPLCWSHPTHVSDNVNYCQVAANGGRNNSNALKFNYSTPTGNLVIMPSMNQPLSDLRVKLWHRSESALVGYSGWMEIGYVTDLTDTSTFVVIDTLQRVTTFTQVTVPFTNAPANSHIAFRHRASGTNWYWLIDEIRVEVMPHCADIENVELIDLSSTSATVTWSSTNAVSYVAECYQGSTLISNWQGTDTVATLTGLAMNNDYNVRVRGICANDSSEWSEFMPLHVGYCQPNPTNVDGVGITNVAFGVGEVMNSNNHPTSSPYYGNYSYLIGALPAGLPANVSITFSTSYTYGTVIWVDWNKNMIFEDDEVVYTGMSAAESPTTLVATFMIDYQQDTGLYRMRIAAADSYFDNFVNNGVGNHDPCATTTYAMFMDYTIRVTEMPACVPVNNLTAVDVTENSATLTWTHPANATYAVVFEGDTLVSGLTEYSYTITGLTPATFYHGDVIATCVDGSVTEAIGVDFITACGNGIGLPFTESFETNSGTRFCWTYVSMNPENGMGMPSGMDLALINSGNMALRFSSWNSANNGDYDQFAFSPVFIAPGNTDSLLMDIRYSTFSTGDNLWFGYITPTDTVWSEESYVTNGQSDMLHYLAAIPNSATQVAIRYNGQYKFYGWIDSVMVTEMEPVQRYAVTVDCDSAQGSVTGAGTYAEGSLVTLTATANEGFAFVGWQEGSHLYESNPYSFYINGDHAFTAVFHSTQVGTYTVSVNCDPVKGSVVGAGTYSEGATVTLTATPNEGYEFVGWVEGANVYEANPYTFTISENHTFLAMFRTVGIDDVENSGLALYPNPATTSVTLTGLTEGSRVVLLDLNGRESGEWRVESGELRIDVSGLPKGAYFVRIVSPATITVRKLIVK